MRKSMAIVLTLMTLLCTTMICMANPVKNQISNGNIGEEEGFLEDADDAEDSENTFQEIVLYRLTDMGEELLLEGVDYYYIPAEEGEFHVGDAENALREVTLYHLTDVGGVLIQEGAYN